MATKKASRGQKPVQTGNLVSVVGTFGKVPCSIAAYQTEKQALKAYEEAKRVHCETKSRETGSEVKAVETVEDKVRGCKTSRSGLPSCWFKPESGEPDLFGLAVVRGPVYASPPTEISYVAILRNGILNVVGFADASQAIETYGKIRESYNDDYAFEEDPPEEEYAAFNTEDISVARGIAAVVPKGGRCTLK